MPEQIETIAENIRAQILALAPDGVRATVESLPAVAILGAVAAVALLLLWIIFALLGAVFGVTAAPWATRDHLRLLAAALDDVDGPLHLVTTLRSDLLGQLERLPELALRLNHAGRYLLLPMNEDGLREALLGPCARAGLRAEPGLLAQVVADTAGLAGCLPLLGHALRAVYEARSGDLLTLASYQRLGGVSGALALATADLLTSLGAEGSARARRLLLALVRIGPVGEATRRALSRDEALRAAGGDALAEQLGDVQAGAHVGEEFVECPGIGRHREVVHAAGIAGAARPGQDAVGRLALLDPGHQRRPGP